MRTNIHITLPAHHECSANWGDPLMCDGYFVECRDCTWTPVHGPVELQDILAELAQGAVGC